eukprot:TRINITY_DN2564_c0_g1_i2.p1 TRINITY_DN2564_c0_g1~~TRINITY_DN2564_c0_g1_i2.p1  ORF type:complete len:304 (+),score=44.14 TRINITY_DN2564_c0_g1_i2:88-999(+)
MVWGWLEDAAHATGVDRVVHTEERIAKYAAGTAVNIAEHGAHATGADHLVHKMTGGRRAFNTDGTYNDELLKEWRAKLTDLLTPAFINDLKGKAMKIVKDNRELIEELAVIAKKLPASTFQMPSADDLHDKAALGSVANEAWNMDACALAAKDSMPKVTKLAPFTVGSMTFGGSVSGGYLAGASLGAQLVVSDVEQDHVLNGGVSIAGDFGGEAGAHISGQGTAGITSGQVGDKIESDMGLDVTVQAEDVVGLEVTLSFSIAPNGDGGVVAPILTGISVGLQAGAGMSVTVLGSASTTFPFHR